MTKRKVKKQVIYLGSAISLLLVSLLSVIELSNHKTQEPTYVNKTIFENNIPVVSTKETIIRPYTDNTVRIITNYYNPTDEEEIQKNSIIYYENTYLQSTGIDYQTDYNFDVVSILDGTVIKVEENSILGNIVEIKHKDEIISTYQSLSEINVKEGDTVKQGTIIGKSGESNLQKDRGSHLHFELIINSQTVDPEEYYDKELGEI